MPLMWGGWHVLTELCLHFDEYMARNRRVLGFSFLVIAVVAAAFASNGVSLSEILRASGF